VLRGWLPDEEGDSRYRVGFIRGGRGSGKTKTASWHMAELMVRYPGNEWACVAPTFADARDVCMEGMKSGLIVALGGTMGGEGRLIDPGPHIRTYNRSSGQLRLNNGGIVFLDGADDGAYRIQGKNLAGVWGDELGLWKKWKAAFDESIRYAVRITPAKVLVTGTPKRSLSARILVERLLKDDRVLDVQLYTEENLHNLDPAAAAEFMASKGTALERQELYGDLLSEVEGALWRIATIEGTRIDIPPHDPEEDPFAVQAIFDLIQPTRVGVAVDPAASYGEDSDEHGIIIAAKGADGDLYILEDDSFNGPVTQWPLTVIEAYDRWQCDRVIAETNHGADYIDGALKAAGYRGGYEKITASRGKQVRAQPVATYHERGHVHMVGVFSKLEEQLTTWVPGENPDDSPDRLDAMVYICAWLAPRLAEGWSSVYKPLTDEERAEQAAHPRRGWAAVYQTAQMKERQAITAATEDISPAYRDPEPKRNGYFDDFPVDPEPSRAPTPAPTPPQPPRDIQGPVEAELSIDGDWRVLTWQGIEARGRNAVEAARVLAQTLKVPVEDIRY
jgi:phage terminase large subunit-like protein